MLERDRKEEPEAIGESGALLKVEVSKQITIPIRNFISFFNSFTFPVQTTELQGKEDISSELTLDSYTFRASSADVGLA